MRLSNPGRRRVVDGRAPGEGLRGRAVGGGTACGVATARSGVSMPLGLGADPDEAASPRNEEATSARFSEAEDDQEFMPEPRLILKLYEYATGPIPARYISRSL